MKVNQLITCLYNKEYITCKTNIKETINITYHWFIDTEILTLLKTSANPKSGKKKKKAAEKAVAAETAGADDKPPKLTPANES